MNRIVAFKLIRKDLLADREVVGRFHREIQLVSSLTHPNVVHAYDAGPMGDNYFLAMEYVEGIDLARLVRQQGPLPVERACDFIRQAALGLQHIHERGLVHRDIKPSNLLVAQGSGLPPGGVVKILDLGLARLHRPANGELTRDLTTHNPVTMGTLDYMAPEQALDFHEADIRADIYSLGCTFYFLLTARPPFPDGTLTQKLLRHQQAKPVPVGQVRSEVPPQVTAAIHKMMAKAPADRYQSPGELVADLPLAASPVHLPVPVNGVRKLLPAAAPLRGEVLDPSGPFRRPRVMATLTSISTRTLREVSSRRRWPWVGGAALILFAVLGLLILGLRSGKSSAQSTVAPAPETGPVEPVAALTYLSDLPEQDFQGVAFGKKGHLGHNGNGNIGGVPEKVRIIVKGIVSRNGLSTLAMSQGAAQVRYRLGRRYSGFKTGVALHDGGWFSGSKVTFTVLGDDKVLVAVQEDCLPTEDYPQVCAISVAGVDVLELQVTCTSSNNGVWPVWLDPCLTK